MPHPTETYTAEQFLTSIADRGFVPNVGQLGPELLKRIRKAVKGGTIIAYKGAWDTGSPLFGIHPFKTCYTSLAIYNDPTNDAFFGRFGEKAAA